MEKSSSPQDQLIVALDVPTFDEARVLMEKLGSLVEIYKVGSQLFTLCGPMAVRYLLAAGKKVFLDLKFHDIPNTVASAVSAAVGLQVGSSTQTQMMAPGIFMYTLHILGGANMLKSAQVAAAQKAQQLEIPRPLGIGVTVLTSDAASDQIGDVVLSRARLAQECRLDGLVASGQDVEMLRREFGSSLKIITPGIRLTSASQNDQQRVATPTEAIKAGSDFLVVGRPIVQAPDPVGAAREFLDEIHQAQNLR